MDDVCRIMIIDDEFIMRQGIRVMIRWEEEGYEIVGEASDGKEGLNLIPELRPHIILSDIAMPVMNGLDLIKIVNREYPDIKMVVLSSYDNYEYVREALVNGAVDYVLKPTLNPEELLKIVSRTAKDIPNLKPRRKEVSAVESLLEIYLTGDGDVGSNTFSDLFLYSCFRLFMLPIRDRHSNGPDLSPVLYEKADTFLKELSYCVSIKFLRQGVICAVINYSVKDEGKLLKELDAFLKQLGLISERILGVLGVRHMRMEELRKEFRESDFMEQEIFYNKGKHLYIKEKINPDKTEAEKFNYRKFTSYIAACKYSNAIEMFRSYIYKVSNSQMQEYKLKNQTKNLLFNLIGGSEEHVQDLEDIRREYFSKLEQSAYCDDFLEVYEEMLHRVDEVLVDTEEGKDVCMGKMLDYLQVHYAEDLTLQGLAEEFNFSYSYLSAYFNQHVSEGFSEYLNRIRIKKACEFLEGSGMPIARVSSVVGYSDHSYFCRVFKRITGRTPSLYRRESR